MTTQQNQGAATVRLRLTQMLAEFCEGQDDLTLPLPGATATAGELLHRLTDTYPGLARLLWTETGDFNPQMVAFCNQADLRALQGMATPLNGGDELMLITAVEGG